MGSHFDHQVISDERLLKTVKATEPFGCKGENSWIQFLPATKKQRGKTGGNQAYLLVCLADHCLSKAELLLWAHRPSSSFAEELPSKLCKMSDKLVTRRRVQRPWSAFSNLVVGGSLSCLLEKCWPSFPSKTPIAFSCIWESLSAYSSQQVIHSSESFWERCLVSYNFLKFAKLLEITLVLWEQLNPMKLDRHLPHIYKLV